MFLFHNSVTRMHRAYKDIITAALEYMQVSGNLHRVIGVDMARVGQVGSAQESTLGVGPGEMIHVLCPVSKGAASVGAIHCDFIMDLEVLNDQHMLNALAEEVAREILKALLQFRTAKLG